MASLPSCTAYHGPWFDDFSQAWQQRVERSVDGVAYWIVSREHLIAMKQAAGRPKDLEDVRVLSRRDGE